MPPANGAEFESIVSELFRKAGWRVRRHPVVAGDTRADMVVDAGNKRYLIEVKGTSEGRRDRLIPLLSQAILQAQAFSRQFPESAAPLAVIGASRVTASLAEQLKLFAEQHAPDVAVGVIDTEGFHSFVGPGLEGLDEVPPRRLPDPIASSQHLPDLFSDLNQWMLKILLGQHLPEPLIFVPRMQIRNASHLAEVADVSVMSASRFINQLTNQGFLDGTKEQLRIVRIEELLELWIAANRQGLKEVPARWVLKRGEHQLQSALREYASPHIPNIPTGKRKQNSQAVLRVLPRCCLGLFAAADALGLGFVRGVPQQIYLERLTLDSLNRLGLMIDHSGREPDVNIRIPVNREAIFRASVKCKDDVPASDVLQIWLDVSSHPARGSEQAREIRRRVLGPLFGKP
jgi:hypothetical protein